MPVSQNAAPENALLQFSAGGYILGFKTDRVYFAAFDHAIIEEFVGTEGVMPAANSRGFKPEAELETLKVSEESNQV